MFYKMTFLFVSGIIANNWHLVLTSPLIYFCFSIFYYRNLRQNSIGDINSGIRIIEEINNRVINSRGYINIINPNAEILLNTLSNRIKEAENNNFQRTLLESLRQRIEYLHQNPIIYLWSAISFIFIWRFYYSTRLNLTRMPTNLNILRRQNIWLYNMLKFMRWAILRRRGITNLFNNF